MAFKMKGFSGFTQKDEFKLTNKKILGSTDIPTKEEPEGIPTEYTGSNDDYVTNVYKKPGLFGLGKKYVEEVDLEFNPTGNFQQITRKGIKKLKEEGSYISGNKYDKIKDDYLSGEYQKQQFKKSKKPSSAPFNQSDPFAGNKKNGGPSKNYSIQLPPIHEYTHPVYDKNSIAPGKDTNKKSFTLFGKTREVEKYVDPATGKKTKNVTVSKKNKDGIVKYRHKSKVKKDGKLESKLKAKGFINPSVNYGERGKDWGYEEKSKLGRRGYNKYEITNPSYPMPKPHPKHV